MRDTMRNDTMNGSASAEKDGPTHIEHHGSDFNEKAHSDDFDAGSGKVVWDARSVIALISLCLLWYVL
jgi:hypothetical protein